MVLDLTIAADRTRLQALIAEADILVQNLKRGALARLGFDIAALRKEHPRLITCSITGYGEDGPYAEPAESYDALIQAETGLAAITGGPRRRHASVFPWSTSRPAPPPTPPFSKR